jgi:hypothetical protein
MGDRDEVRRQSVDAVLGLVLQAIGETETG